MNNTYIPETRILDDRVKAFDEIGEPIIILFQDFTPDELQDILKVKQIIKNKLNYLKVLKNE